jgi:hypothetical protein
MIRTCDPMFKKKAQPQFEYWLCFFKILCVWLRQIYNKPYESTVIKNTVFLQ